MTEVIELSLQVSDDENIQLKISKKSEIALKLAELKEKFNLNDNVISALRDKIQSEFKNTLQELRRRRAQDNMDHINYNLYEKGKHNRNLKLEQAKQIIKEKEKEEFGKYSFAPQLNVLYNAKIEKKHSKIEEKLLEDKQKYDQRRRFRMLQNSVSARKTEFKGKIKKCTSQPRLNYVEAAEEGNSLILPPKKETKRITNSNKSLNTKFKRGNSIRVKDTNSRNGEKHNASRMLTGQSNESFVGRAAKASTKTIKRNVPRPKSKMSKKIVSRSSLKEVKEGRNRETLVSRDTTELRKKKLEAIKKIAMQEYTFKPEINRNRRSKESKLERFNRLTAQRDLSKAKSKAKAEIQDRCTFKPKKIAKRHSVERQKALFREKREELKVTKMIEEHEKKDMKVNKILLGTAQKRIKKALEGSLKELYGKCFKGQKLNEEVLLSGKIAEHLVEDVVRPAVEIMEENNYPFSEEYFVAIGAELIQAN